MLRKAVLQRAAVAFLGVLPMWAALTALATLALGVPRSAAAVVNDEKPRVAIMPLIVDAEVPDEVRKQAGEQIRAVLRGDQYTVVEGRAQGANCTDSECIHAVATDANARYVVVPTLSTLDHDYEITLSLYDVAGELKASEKTTCEICSYDDVVAALGAGATAIEAPLLKYVANPYGDREPATAEDAGPSKLTVRTDPPGASVVVDGERIGKTPLSIDVDPGLRDIEVRLRDHNDLVETVRVPRGDTKILNYELTENNAQQTRALRISGWTFSMVGVGLLGGGIPLLVLEERPVKRDCDGDNVDGSGRCRYRYDTLLPGGLLTGFGIASLLTGITTGAIAASRRERRKSKGLLDTMDEDTISVRPILGPTSAGLEVRF